MENNDLIAYAIILLGTAATLAGAYQMIKRGFLLWIMVIIVGVTGVNYGLSATQGSSLDGFLDDLNAGKLTSFSQAQIQKLCDQESMGGDN